MAGRRSPSLLRLGASARSAPTPANRSWDDLVTRLQGALADRYTIEREIGRGGMATVYLARDLRHDRAVALKVLKPELAAALGPDWFLREIRTTARLTHSHILPLLDSGEAAGTLFYVMPFLEGESLRDRLRREKQLPLEDALQIAREVADALAYAHRHDVIHRDIKPENILLENGHALVADFGIARAVRADAQPLTPTGLAVGTPPYMSPEQATASRDLDGRSDLYSLGCVLYEMLSGDPPFTGQTAEAILAKKLGDPLPRISVVRETVSPEIEAVLAKALARAPADRFRTAAEFAAALAHPESSQALARRQSALSQSWPLGMAATVAGVALIGGAMLLYLRARQPGPTITEPVKRVAALPLTNLMGDTSQNYFVDGLHDLLITDLAKSPDISVISRSSVMGYRNVTKPVPEVAKELSVGAVVEGSVLRTGDSLVLNIQLIDGRTDRHIWAESYPGTTRSALSLPAAAARAIAGRLGAAGHPRGSETIRAQLIDPRATDLYLKGRYFCFEWTPEGYRQGSQDLRQAIEIDPTFAQAYAALGECYATMPFQTFASPEDAFPKAQAAAEKALALDSTLGGVYVTRALVKWQYKWDSIGPEADFVRAIELSPSNEHAHVWYASWLVSRGRFDEAVREQRTAIALDPLTMPTTLSLGWVYLNARRYDSSVAVLKRSSEMSPDAYWPHLQLAWNYTLKGMNTSAVRECRQAMALAGPGDQMVLTGCAWAYAQVGKQPEARQLLSAVLEIGKHQWVDPYNVAAVYGVLGDRDQAFRWLDRTIKERSAEVPFMRVDPFLDSLRPDPRFAALQKRTGL